MSSRRNPAKLRSIAEAGKLAKQVWMAIWFVLPYDHEHVYRIYPGGRLEKKLKRKEPEFGED